ncbi:MAG: hypothetical protein H7Y00_05180 [Fimbriimonadaceae bacterium]|nr:hypothetical protein [Chitinophagales bacterium]
MKYFILFTLFLISQNVLAQDCSQTSTGFIPIADLGKDTFQNFTGGKYPNGSNAIPLVHYNKGIELSKQIQPLNIHGDIDTSNGGKIGFLVLGFSTAAMTGRYFRNMNEILGINNKVEVIIGAQGGQDINAMTSEKSTYWRNTDSIIQSNKLSAKQIQVVWISTGDILNYKLPFPDQSTSQIEKYRFMLMNIKIFYPNIKMVFISDRTYAGYIGNENGPQKLKEPTAYYTSWTVKWLIEKQIKNEPGFTYSEIPFMDWGPMLWTDGEKGNTNGYTWNCDDAGKGGIHPSSKGRAKEAMLLYLFFTQHPYTKNWLYELSK